MSAVGLGRDSARRVSREGGWRRNASADFITRRRVGSDLGVAGLLSGARVALELTGEHEHAGKAVHVGDHEREELVHVLVAPGQLQREHMHGHQRLAPHLDGSRCQSQTAHRKTQEKPTAEHEET
eukprot:3452119-Rhodomonas_salina.1